MYSDCSAVAKTNPRTKSIKPVAKYRLSLRDLAMPATADPAVSAVFPADASMLPLPEGPGLPSGEAELM